MSRFFCLVLLATVFAVSAEREADPEVGYRHAYTQRQGRRIQINEDDSPLANNRYGSRQNNPEEVKIENVPIINVRYSARQKHQENGDKVDSSSLNSRYSQPQKQDDEDEEEDGPLVNNVFIQNQNHQREVDSETISLVNELLKQQNQERKQPVNIQENYNLHEKSQDENVAADSRKFDINTNYHRVEEPSEDSITDAATSYTSMVLHNDPEQQRSSSSPQYKTIRGKVNKNYSKPYRQNLRDTPVNYKPFKNIQQEEPPPQHSQQQIPVTPTPGDPFVHSVHPSIMQSLLNQQPQTFDVPQQKDTGEFEQAPHNWQAHPANANSNIVTGFKSYATSPNAQQDSASAQESYDMNKRPIYVPNRVSVQNPSSDSSFNVGYSIGFGSGLVQPPKIGIVQPPANLRQGKEMPYPASYQNTPTSVHIDGKNTIWKNMGGGVEMSHNIEPNVKTYNPYPGGTASDNNEHSSGTVINQPLFYREGLDESFTNIPALGRNNFDHNHALQQSNSFDFSNAIDPSTNSPYSTDQKSIPFSKQIQPSYIESLTRQSFPTYTESFPKQSHPLYSESSSKQTRPSYLESAQKPDIVYSHPAQHTHAIVTSGGRQNYEGLRYELPRYEKPVFTDPSLGPLKSFNSITLNPKPKAIDFSKSLSSSPKPSYNLKSYPSSNLNHFSDEIYGHSFGFPGVQMVPPIYATAGKAGPNGMVQAILVPVNTPSQSYSYPVGMPIMGHGYSPYFGQPIGMIRMPEPIGNGPSFKGGYENSEPLNSPAESQQYPSNYQKSPTMKIVHSHYSTVAHQKELPTEPPQYHIQRTPHSHLRDEEVNDHRPQLKFKRLYTTEAPDHTHPGVKTQSPPSLHSSSEFLESTPPPYPVSSHHPRPYRKGSMIIVKRT